jgi:GAF domain-containing protein
VTLSRKGAKSRTRGRKLRSSGTKASVRVGREQKFAELEKKLEARTRELAEALEQQTATSEVLRVISSSPGELEPVFQAILENATRICGAKFGNLFLRERDAFRVVATYGASAEHTEFQRREPLVLDHPHVPLGRVAQTKAVVHVRDLRAEQAYLDRHPRMIKVVETSGARTLLAVPMLQEASNLIGAIAIYRQEVRPFTDKQIALVSNFAAQAVIAIENARLLGELRGRTDDLTEALEQQTATSEVLGVISRSPGELEPVFEAMLANATRICGAKFGSLYLYNGEAYRAVAFHNAPAAFVEARKSQTWFRPPPDGPLGRVAVSKQVEHDPDIKTTRSYIERSPPMTTAVDLGGFRTALAVPMLKENELIGAITIARQEVSPFSDKQIGLVGNFAKQAVIAIENTRLLNELRESLQQQTAMSNILRVISGSATDVQPVFQTIVGSAVDLCGATYGIVFRYDGELITVAAHHNLDQAALEAIHRIWPRRPDNITVMGRTILERRVVHIEDVECEPGYTVAAAYRTSLGIRTYLSVPMLRDGNPIGGIALYRRQVALFSDREIELVKAFADQAVIAIENTRLLNELRESLQQQTATADVLKVISRSTFDLQTVLDTLVESAVRLCEADMGAINRPKDGGALIYVASYGLAPEFKEFMKRTPIVADRGTITGRAWLEGRTVHIPDVRADPEYTFTEGQRIGGFRTMLGVPLLREGQPIGVIVLQRQTVRPFTDKQIELVTTFADQAVIAIENVRLFDEVQARTRELSEALEQQTAMSEILGVIAASPTNIEPVLRSVAESACRVCEAYDSLILLREGGRLRLRAHHGPIPVHHLDIPIGRGFASGRAVIDREPIHVHDMQAATAEFPRGAEMALRSGFRSLLSAPLLREDEPIGTISLRRTEVRPFSDKQIALLRTFADQAVIAIENARLFDEAQARTRELAQSVSELQALGEVSQAVNSTLDVEAVLDTIVSKAVQLSETEAGAIYVHDEGQNKFELRSTYGMSEELIAGLKDQPIGMGDAIGEAAAQRKPLQIADLRQEPSSPVTELVTGITDARNVI